MITSKYNWKNIEKEPDNGFFELTKKEKLTELASQILYSRGVDTAEKLIQFLSTDLSQLHDPYLLHDMDKAVNRIRQAIENYEQILVYGDYDADGMTSASIMKEALEMLGAEAQVYLPNRFTDGYGPNESVYKYFIEQQNVSLIITVDNGVAGNEAIAYAQSQGVDVIVTDHHGLPAELPEAFAIVHPEHPEADYPFKYLAGCGVAFKVACALLESIPTEMLDLVAIGTIADMVSLTDENRIMVKVGLEILKQTERIGLIELIKVSDVDMADVNEETVGFKIAPQLNALGRLDDPNPAVELLTGFDDEEAHNIAKMINAKNEERKEIVQKIFDEAMSMVDLEKPVQVLAKEGWHPGVLGIVAGRILEQIAQPVIVLNIEDGIAKGSARSIEAINIFHALDEHRDLFEVFGGHAGAAGMTLVTENLDKLSQVLCDYIAENDIDLSQKKELVIDEVLELSEINLDTVHSLEKLAPFGMDNPKPVFEIKDFVVKQARTMGQNGAHLKLKIAQGTTAIDLVAFNQGHLAQEFQQVQNLCLATTLSINKWNGQTTVQLMLEDARVEGVQLIDIRSKTASLPERVPVLTEDSTANEVVVLDIPDKAEELKSLFVGRHFEAIYFKNHIKRAYYLTGYGTRDQFAKLYKTIYQFPEFDVRYKLKELSQYLNIPDILLIKMIQIFDELDFVTITDGVMVVNKDAQKRSISESQIYQDLKQQVKFQELMALATPQEIYEWLINESDE
ncbi:MAG: single-stranded-DNA-specific exonuclease RecJ [Streptococcus sp.]|uniref:single-stranded-DNA-specific exonuclease RecJ n=1 Tax=Streptococcus sp. TaxID=1306 RepID=UPI002589AA4D|nr:single-stranded-DNA-specific exonuclease RecJ [Streptococcus sp.]MCI7517149.1 single-stranded-DNA-specific exonuclease RecJ [Streptococcus sp.]MDY5269802.1 single-stranded-DNA-specific exonuclease RecJ [Streptococcus sp.]